MGNLWGTGRTRPRNGDGDVLTASDRAALTRFADQGVAHLPRHWLHFWYGVEERDARAAADQMRRAGWGVRRIGRARGQEGWAVVADRAGVVVDAGAVAEARRFFSGLAERYRGDYDGWDTAVAATSVRPDGSRA